MSFRKEMGDGIVVTHDFVDKHGLECTYTIDGDQAAVAYVDQHGAPRVDVSEALHLDLTGFRRKLIVYVCAWSKAEQLAALWRAGVNVNGVDDLSTLFAGNPS